MAEPLTILEAVDRLNSWIRSDSAHRWGFDRPTYAIYDFKQDLIVKAIKAGTANCSAVHLMLTCRDCGGDGRYVDSYGETHDHCRKCSNTGKVRLWFLVTEIGDYRWHTPRERSYSLPIDSSIWDKESLSVDWEPNAKGRDLETWQVAECLNVCEEAVARGDLKKPGWHGGWDYEVRHDRYKLYLGSSPTVCQLCGHVGVPKDPGKPDWCDGIHHGCSRDHYSWSSWACDACKELHGHNNMKIFSLFEPPAGSMDHPEIVAWLRRRGIRMGVAA